MAGEANSNAKQSQLDYGVGSFVFQLILCAARRNLINSSAESIPPYLYQVDEPVVVQ